MELHSYPCFGAYRKLKEWEFANAHRMNELTEHGKQWHDILKEDARKFSEECSRCKAKKATGV